MKSSDSREQEYNGNDYEEGNEDQQGRKNICTTAHHKVESRGAHASVRTAIILSIECL